MERWLQVPGYEDAYEVSDQGRVRSLSRIDARGCSRSGKLLSPRKNSRKRHVVALYANGVRRDMQVHHLVLLAFVGPPPSGMEGCHRDDDPANNQLVNLRWDSRSANALDCVRNGHHPMASRTHCPQGHAYTPENTYIHPRGSRLCRECRGNYRELHREELREKGRAYARKRREAARSASTKIEKVL